MTLTRQGRAIMKTKQKLTIWDVHDVWTDKHYYYEGKKPSKAELIKLLMRIEGMGYESAKETLNDPDCENFNVTRLKLEKR